MVQESGCELWGARSGWWYSGWRLACCENLPWAGIVFAGYAALIMGGSLLWTVLYPLRGEEQ